MIAVAIAAGLLAVALWWARDNLGQLLITSVVEPTKTPTPILTPTPLAGIVREIGGIPFVYVPAGEFEMGSNLSNEQPAHIVYLDSYWIMQTEVTNAQYATCVEAKACREPNNDLWNVSNYSDHPVTHMNWEDVGAYARWLSNKSGQAIRLPTEAEWEKAARGVDGRIYPWGDDAPDSSLLNYDRNVGDNGDTTPVGSYPDGASPYGALDMAGNVWEWTADWYADDYYATSPARNPQGPESGTLRVRRGGSWGNERRWVRVSDRSKNLPFDQFNSLGLRLASPGF